MLQFSHVSIFQALRVQAVQGEQEDARDGNQFRRPLYRRTAVLHDCISRPQIRKRL